MTNRVGQKIGNYRLVHLLGQGGFAGVYLAEHLYLGSSAHTSLNNLASTGGTPYYMVPERTVSGSVTHRQRPVLSGCRCLRVAMRYTTLYSRHTIQVGYQHTHEPMPPVRQQISILSPAVELVVMTALAKKSEDRFGSIRAFATALQQASLHISIKQWRNSFRASVPMRIDVYL